MSNQKNDPIVSISAFREEKQKKEAAKKDGWMSTEERINELDNQIEDYQKAITDAEDALKALEDELKKELARRQGKSSE